MLPDHVRSLDDAVYWILRWLDRVGAEAVQPEDWVLIELERSGVPVGLAIPEAAAQLHGGGQLTMRVYLGPRLLPSRYAFNFFNSDGVRQWGWHGHPEPTGFHHRHDPPDYIARPADPANFEAVAELVHIA
ncbi:MAG: hypothetical protein ACYCTI_06780 [Acidimicrobiales bacterium]